MTTRIENVVAREVIDRKGWPTVEVDVMLEDGALGRAAAPAGTSRGINEPVDLRDGDEQYFEGRGVSKAAHNVETEIAGALRGRPPFDQAEIDGLLLELDGTENRSRLGSNAIVATSLANAKAAAASLRVPLFERLGGGQEIPLCFVYLMFAGPAYVGIEGICDFQEFALMPLFAESYKEGYVASLPIYEKLWNLLSERTGMGIPNIKSLSGALLARFDSNEEALATLTRLIEEEGYRPREDFGYYLDIAASQFYRDGEYHLDTDGRVLTTEEMIDWLETLCDRYPILGMEDCLFEDDWEGWRRLTERLGSRVQLVGDDLFVTNARRLARGIDMGVANALVIKPNQVGTLTETIETIRMAKEAGYGTVISPRSAELWDPYVSHLCVGQNLGQGKIVGAYSGGENNLNELMRIQDALGERAVYRGKAVLSRFLS